MNQDPLDWQVSLLSTGEIRLEEKLMEEGQRPMGGHMVRMLNIAADGRAYCAFDNLHGTALGSEFINQLKRHAVENYGTAGQSFVKKLIELPPEGRDKAVDVLRKFEVALREAIPEETYHQKQGPTDRAISRFAVAILAGELATMWNITGWPHRTTMQAIKELFIDWFDELNRPMTAATRATLASVRERLQAALPKFTDISTAKKGKNQPDVFGWKDTNYLYVSASAWQTMFPGNGTERARLLRETGYLVTGNENGFMKRGPRQTTDLNGDRPRFYTVQTTLLTNDQDQ